MELLSSPFGGIAGLIHIVLFIWALVQILNSSMGGVSKILWILVVGLFPIIGLLIYLFMGRKS